MVFALGGGAGVVWALARMKGIELTVTVLQAGNEELRARLSDAHTALAAEKSDCSRKIANLEGQMQVITSHLAEQIVAAVTEASKNAADAARLVAATAVQAAADVATEAAASETRWKEHPVPPAG